MIAGAALGIVVVSALWWLYFDVAAIVARRRLMEATGLELHRLALHAYSYLHLPMVAGVVLFALGLKTTLGDVGTSLDTVPAAALCGGAALYLLGHIAYLFRATRHLFRRRTAGAVLLLALIPVAVAIPALAALALVSAVCSLVAAYEAIRYRADRLVLRHPELAGVLLLCLLVAACADSGAPPRKPDLLVFGVAPDYDEIAYDIVAVRPDGRGRRILTRGASGNSHDPLWSPDGRQIAFDLTESTPPESSLYVMDADGTDRRPLVPKRDGYSHAVGWSPDGERILYRLAKPSDISIGSLWMVDVDGTGKRRLGPNARDASWSPDGSTIAFVTGDNRGEPAVHLLDVREGETRLRTRGATSPRWTPDGARIVFRKVFQGKRSGIYVVERESGSPQLLTRLRDDQDPYLGEVSPDGSSVLVGYHPGISRISLDDGRLQKLTNGRSDWGPAWSPDGKRIAFERNGDIWLMDAEGKNEHVVARAPRLAVYDRPHWRPSG